MKKKITFAALVNQIASETGESKKLIRALLVETVAINTESLKEEGRSILPWFGHFSLKWQKERKRRNTKTGETVSIQAHNTVQFKTQTKLANYINRHFANMKSVVIKAKAESPKEKTDVKASPEIKAEVTPILSPTPEIKKENIPQATKSFTETPLVKKSPPVEKKQKDPVLVQADANQTLKPETPVKDDTTKSAKPEVISSKTKEAKQVPNDPKLPPSTPKKTKKAFPWWLWILILFLVILLIWFFWPSADLKENMIEEPSQTEIKTIRDEEKPESIVPVELPETQTENTEEEKVSIGIASIQYKIGSNDYLYSIAKKHYKNAILWPLIYQANRSNIPNPHVLLSGSEITLPALQGTIENLSVQDKKDIANAYLEVYLYYKDKDNNKSLSFLWVANQLDSGILENNINRVSKKDIEVIKGIEGELKF